MSEVTELSNSICVDQQWETPPPDAVGIWSFLCLENGHRPERIEIFWKDNAFWVECPHVGKVPLSDYHSGLSFPKWFR